MNSPGFAAVATGHVTFSDIYVKRAEVCSLAGPVASEGSLTTSGAACRTVSAHVSLMQACKLESVLHACGDIPSSPQLLKSHVTQVSPDIKSN